MRGQVRTGEALRQYACDWLQAFPDHLEGAQRGDTAVLTTLARVVRQKFRVTPREAELAMRAALQVVAPGGGGLKALRSATKNVTKPQRPHESAGVRRTRNR